MTTQEPASERTRLLGVSSIKNPIKYTSPSYVQEQLVDLREHTIDVREQVINIVTTSADTVTTINPTKVAHPTVPLERLTDKVQDILVFGDLKQKTRVESKESGNETVKVSQHTEKSTSRGIGGESSKSELVASAFRMASDHWKDRQEAKGSKGSSQSLASSSSVSLGNALRLPEMGLPDVNMPNSAEHVWSVAKGASVCAVMSLLNESHKGSAAMSDTAKANMQQLALSTLEMGLRDSSATDHVVREMLCKKWLNGTSALEWAIKNDCQIFLKDPRVASAIEDTWKYGPDWRADPNHPSAVWRNGNDNSKPPTWTVFIITRLFYNYLARWASPRYQDFIGLFSLFVYLLLHLATVINEDYTDYEPYPYEYAYYFFVISDTVLEVWKLLAHPIQTLRRGSSYLALICVSLLTAAMALRFIGLNGTDLEVQAGQLELSHVLITCATPLMVLRLLGASNDLSWSIVKLQFTIGACFADALEIMLAGIAVILAFWLALGALQHNDMSYWDMLRYLILGALHSPNIGDTIQYRPFSAGILLAIYMFLISTCVGSFLTASFLCTMSNMKSRLADKKQGMAYQRAMRPATLDAFIPNTLIELPLAILSGLLRLILRRKNRIVWLERTRQVLWYMVFSPVILIIGFFDLLSFMMRAGKRISGLKPKIVPSVL
ncbi:uncharacterized protein BYT42DRAFT_644451 [Radiomyces spectabilis]|uniref:uncharacterized protein n=1 Tax=Radiomyces spectabilis TaxID=64574 RepID=UPI00221F149D|nr:uncharacterized protein BYT42DRAFT_644451 [Radiomyces spectabilis]KAI8379136.1 hypothetical protein BYT42DRAFT_644451 [Radiomyces spectabilis]